MKMTEQSLHGADFGPTCWTALSFQTPNEFMAPAELRDELVKVVAGLVRRREGAGSRWWLVMKAAAISANSKSQLQ